MNGQNMDSSLSLRHSVEFLQARRKRFEASLSLVDQVILIGSGAPIPIPGGADQIYPFRAHSHFLYLVDQHIPHSALLFSPQCGWRLFAPVLEERDFLWTNPPQYEAEDSKNLNKEIAKLAPSALAVLGVDPAQLEHAADLQFTDEVDSALVEQRLTQDEVAIDRIRHAVGITREVFYRLGQLLVPGKTERQVMLGLEFEMLSRGADRPAYETIVGFGEHASVLHCVPGARKLHEGDTVLVDLGAETKGYVCDVTRTASVGPHRQELFYDLFALVSSAKKEVIAHAKAGTSFVDLHRRAEGVLLDGLRALGVLIGSHSELKDSGVLNLFFPHGLGHTVGLGVRDAGSFVKEARRPDLDYPPHLRFISSLRDGMVITIEPGLYFSKRVLTSASAEGKFSKIINWELSDRLIEIGGIRLEDNILVGQDGSENLTASIPEKPLLP